MTEQTWLTDTNGNKCSVEYFGSVEAAQKALDSLIGCENCENCSRCSDCSGGTGNFAPPSIPTIENIHAKVFEAASNPETFDMSRGHGETAC